MNGTGIGEVRTKLLNTDHKQWDCGMGVFDPGVVYTLEDPNGYVVVDGKLSKIVSKSDYEKIYKKIGDKVYKTVNINGVTWMAESLDYKWDDLIIGTEGVSDNDRPRAAYPDDNEAKWGHNGRKIGLYYNGNSIGQLNSKIDGWRLPTQGDFEVLLNSITVENKPHVNELIVPEVSWISEEFSEDYLKTPVLNKTGLSLLPASCMDYGSIYATYPFINLPALNNIYYKFTFPYQGYWESYIYGTVESSTEQNLMYPITVRLVKAETVTIGNKKYNTVRIGNKQWITENLDFIPEGVKFVTSGSDAYTVPAACYYNYTNTGLGLLYNKQAVAYINNILPDGWRIATLDDFQDLMTHIGGNTEENILKLKSSDTSGIYSWSTHGSDVYGLKLIRTGYRTSEGGFDGDSQCVLFTSTVSGSGTYQCVIQNGGEAVFSNQVSRPFEAIRLVKDV